MRLLSLLETFRNCPESVSRRDKLNKTPLNLKILFVLFLKVKRQGNIEDEQIHSMSRRRFEKVLLWAAGNGFSAYICRNLVFRKLWV